MKHVYVVHMYLSVCLCVRACVRWASRRKADVREDNDIYSKHHFSLFILDDFLDHKNNNSSPGADLGTLFNLSFTLV